MTEFNVKDKSGFEKDAIRTGCGQLVGILLIIVIDIVWVGGLVERWIFHKEKVAFNFNDYRMLFFNIVLILALLLGYPRAKNNKK